jgi:hypothetical protein
MRPQLPCRVAILDGSYSIMKKLTQPVRLKLKLETMKTLRTAELVNVASGVTVETFHTLERSCVDC